MNVQFTEAICVVIPMYMVEFHIQKVISGIPDWVDHIIVVDDASPDQSAELALAVGDDRVVLVSHIENHGVGGAMLTGYKKAVELGATIMVKMDGDGQMSPDHLPELIQPILEAEADYVKGNRFSRTGEIRSMPFIRRIGNLSLSFLTKIASGYWNVFDPTNGYTAIDADVFRRLDLTHIHPRYFFETSMLIELNLHRAVIAEVAMPAQYGSERSSLSVKRALLEFPFLLLRGCISRVWLQFFALDFSIASLFLIVGTWLMIFAGAWGGYAWASSIRTGVASTTGTVMIAALPLILGFQLLLQALVCDVQNVPKRPLSRLTRLRQSAHQTGPIHPAVRAYTRSIPLSNRCKADNDRS